MKTESRLFFLGAGASCAVGYPVTADLMTGIANAVLENPTKYERLASYLEKMYSVENNKLLKLSRYWKSNYSSVAQSKSHVKTLPQTTDVTEFLSAIDVLIDDDARLGHYRKISGSDKLIHARELDRIRQKVVEALCEAFDDLDKLRGPGSGKSNLIKKFAEITCPEDFVVTTNWDLLLDKELHKKSTKQTYPLHCGTDCIVVDFQGNPIKVPDKIISRRPPLLKLHGSFNWLYCHRCTRLYVNPLVYLAGIPFVRMFRSTDASKCDCGMNLSTIIVTPTYVKKYRNRHLANIWATTLQALIEVREWIFIGYSFPPDDLHIRVLLMKALATRKDPGRELPKITVVTKDPNGETVRRFKVMFSNPRIVAGFEEYLEEF